MKVIRNPPRKINFRNQEPIEPNELEKQILKQVAEYKKPVKKESHEGAEIETSDEDEIDEKLQALEESSILVGKIQDEISRRTEELEQKGKILSEKEEELKKESERIEELEKELEKIAVLWTSLNNLDINTLKPEEIKKITQEQEGFIRDLLENYIKATEQEKEYLERIEFLKKENKELMQEVDNALEEINKIKEDPASNN